MPTALYPYNSRDLVDNTLVASVALPNNTNVKNTDGIDTLGVDSAYPTSSQYLVVLSTTAGAGANTKNINITLQDSADNITFANIVEMGNGTPLLRVTCANEVFPASSVKLVLPPTVNRYIRGRAVGESGSLDASAGALTCKLAF
jgi:hypothetical protein